MILNLRRRTRQISAFILLSAGVANAAAYDYASVRPEAGKQYFIYSLSAGSFLSDADTLQNFPKTLWTLGEDGSLSSDQGRYISIFETHEDSKRLGVTIAREYTFHAASSAQSSAILSNLEDSEDETSPYYLFGNNSFDIGDLSSWNSTGDEPAETTTVVSTEGIQGAQGRYMLNCGYESGRATAGQLMFQPLIGLPQGVYEASAAMAADQGALRTNSAHMNAIVVPASLFEGIDSITVRDVISKIGVILRDGKITTGSVKTANCDELQVATCEFQIKEENDIVLIGMNAGLVPLTGSVPYRADNVRLLLKSLGNPSTAVERVETDALMDDDTLYDLQGRRVQNPTPGLYIRRAQKIIIK